MTRLGIDLRGLQEGFKAHKKRGIGVYVRSLIERKKKAPSSLDLLPWFDPALEAEEPAIHGAEPYVSGRLGALAAPYLKESLKQVLVMRPIIDQTAQEANAAGIFFPSHLDAPPGLKTPYAATAHDMIQAALAERNYGTLKDRLWVKMQIAALQKARLIITVSEHSRKDVVKYAGVDPGKVEVVHNGVDPIFKPGVTGGLERFGLPEKFILYVGGIDWRKNMDLLFDSFAALAATNKDYHLVMTGDIARDKGYARHREKIERSGLADKVHSLGFVTTPELCALYNAAEIFVYPSLYEGFGLPVLEAMACGAAVLTTNCSSLPEVAGDGAVLCDPDDPAAFTAALIRLASETGYRAEIAVRGVVRASRFTWEKCAKETFELLDTFANGL